jgi:hypothetical protein
MPWARVWKKYQNEASLKCALPHNTKLMTVFYSFVVTDNFIDIKFHRPRREESNATRSVPRLDTLHASRKVCSIGLRYLDAHAPSMCSGTQKELRFV